MSKKAQELDGLIFVKGTPFKLSDTIGKKVVVVEFWATWCPPCKATIPHLSKIAQKFKDTVEIVGITVEQNESLIKNFVDQMGDKMDYSVAIDSKGLVYNGYMTAFNVSGIPHAFVIDKHGNIVWNDHPAQSSMVTAIEKAVAEKMVVDPKTLSKDELKALPAKELIEILKAYKIDYSDCLEKSDFIEKIENEIINK